MSAGRAVNVDTCVVSDRCVGDPQNTGDDDCQAERVDHPRQNVAYSLGVLSFRGAGSIKANTEGEQCGKPGP